MAKSLQHVQPDRRIEALFVVDEGARSPEGTALLRSFAEQREASAHHCVSCELCDA